MIRAQKADAVLHNVQHTPTEDMTLLLDVGAQQTEDQVMLLEAAIARDIHLPGHVPQPIKGHGLQFSDIHDLLH